MKLSDYVASFIQSLGVKHVFMLTGGGAMHLNNSFGSCRNITPVFNLHEQASAICAEAYAKATNQIGVALVTTGPGGTNTVTGVAGAWLDSTPCIFISGQVKRDDLIGDRGVRQFGFQEIDIISIVKPITKYAITITSPLDIKFHLEKAYYLCRTGRPGPVWIDIPLDIQAAQIDPSSLVGYIPETKINEIEEKQRISDLVSQTIALLRQAKRPIIWAGNGVRLAEAQDEFIALVEKLNIPVLLTWLGLDMLPQDHPLFVGRPGSVAPRGANFALQNSDFLLTIGARLDMGSTGYSHHNLARQARKVIVDVDQNEIKKMQTHIDLEVPVDAKEFISEFARQLDMAQLTFDDKWLLRCQEWKEKYPVVLPEYYQAKKINTYIFTEVLCDLLEPNQLVVSGSSGAGIEIFLLAYKVKAAQRVLHTASLGAMGFGLPASIGACLARGNQNTILVDGDGGFQLNSQELETIRRMNLPIKMFILNNGGFASIRASQNKYFGHLTGADKNSGMTLPDLDKLGKAYGIQTVKLSTPDKLREQLKNILKTPGPVLIDVLIPEEEQRAPTISTIQLPDGRLVSRPMEDLCPFLSREEFMQNMIVPIIDDSKN